MILSRYFQCQTLLSFTHTTTHSLLFFQAVEGLRKVHPIKIVQHMPIVFTLLLRAMQTIAYLPFQHLCVAVLIDIIHG